MNNGLLTPTTTAVVDGAAQAQIPSATPPGGEPGPMLGDLLRRPPLETATVLAGNDGLTAAVNGLVSLEAPCAAGWLEGGELVVSTGASLGTREPEWQAFVQGLAEARAAGLLLLSGPQVQLVPESALKAADRLGLPLIALTQSGPLLEVLRPLARLLTPTEADARSAELQRTLLGQVLEGSGLEALARTLARCLERTVVVEDRQFNLLAVGQAGALGEPFVDELVVNKGTPVRIIKAWESDGTLATLRRQKRPLHLEAHGPEDSARSIYPLVISGEVHGYASILDGEPLSPQRAALFEQGRLALSLELLKQQGATESEQKLKRDFFRDLLAADSAAAVETLRRRATYLGYPMNAAYWVIAVEFDEQPGGEVQPEEVARLVAILNALLSFRQAVVVNQFAGATILYPVRDGQPNGEKVAQLTQAIQQKLAASAPDWQVSIGVGQLHETLMGVPHSYREAVHALKIGRHTRGSRHATFFADLGIYRMLLQFAQSQDPSAFFCEPLQRLIDYNQQMDKELVKTIAAFLSCNGNLTETSTRLFIHRNTLKYRLERIRDITGIDLDDAENRLMLHLGLKMNQVLNYLR